MSRCVRSMLSRSAWEIDSTSVSLLAQYMATKEFALNTMSAPYGLFTSFSSHPEAAKSASMRSKTSVRPSERIVLSPVFKSTIFCVKTVSSVIAFGASVPTPKSEPKMTTGSITTSKTGRRRSPTSTPIHFLECLTAARAAPCAPPVAAPLAISATAFPVLAAALTEEAADSPRVLCSSAIKPDPFSWGFAAAARRSSHRR